jgi:DNA-binding NarL/FixJ family response regulator
VNVVALEGAAIRALAAPPAGVTTVVVQDAASAAAALRLAIQGVPIVIHGTAPRPVLDALYDDLRRIARVEIRTGPADADPLTDEERSLLALLGAGISLGEAAAELHMSPRTADRRLASARRKVGATTTTEAIVRAG